MEVNYLITKHSRQREAIKEFLADRTDHPTADMVYENVRLEFPKISLGTVYRNLTFLSDRGEILRLHLKDGVDHFDFTTSEHQHFICNSCGSVIDLPMSTLDDLDSLAGKDFDGTIEGHSLYFYGKCKHCITK